MRTTAIVLAAGRGARMRSALPKGLHLLAGRPLAYYAATVAERVSGAPPLVVLGPSADRLREALGGRAVYLTQPEPQGNAHAVLQARELLQDQAGPILVIPADMPLLSEATLRRMLASHTQHQATLTLLAVGPGDPRGRGRLVHDRAGAVSGVVAEGACTPEQLASCDLNSGVYYFSAGWMWEQLPRLRLRHSGESDLADLVGLAHVQGLAPDLVYAGDRDEVIDVNSRVDLAEAGELLRARINRAWMEAGVTLLSPSTTYIDADVTIGPDTTILPNTFLRGRTSIGSDCRIGPDTMVEDSAIADRCRVTMSVLEGAAMEESSDIGPFGHLRKGARLCRGAHMGNFGEMKNATLGPNSLMGHFSYLGDAEVGANVNIGCGTITCNFDGKRKNPTVIEDGAFIGSDSLLVAPVRVGRGAKTGAGSVVTHDIPAGAVAYGVPARVREGAAPSSGSKPSSREVDAGPAAPGSAPSRE